MIHHNRSFLIWLLGGLYMLVVLTGCAPQSLKPALVNEMSEDVGFGAITAIDGVTDMKGRHLRIESTKKLLFTAIKQADPPMVSFYFHNTRVRLENPLPTQFPAPLKAIVLRPPGKHSQSLKMDLVLTEDVPYTVDQVNGHLQVTLPNPRGGEKRSVWTTLKKTEGVQGRGNSTASSRLTAVEAFYGNGLTQIRIGISQAVADVQEIALSDPPRIVVNLYGIADQHIKEQVEPVHLPGVRQVRYLGDGRKLRVVIDTEPQFLNNYSVSRRSDSVVIVINARPVPTARPVSIQSINYAVAQDREALLTVRADRPFQYLLDRVEPTWLRLRLQNSIFTHRVASLPTDFGPGPIAGLMPKQVSATEAQIDIILKKAAPYLVDQKDSRLFLQFNPALFETAPVARETEHPALQTTIAATENEIPAPKYSGEPIALNLHDADIRNLFKIIADVSGINFAIDKDVTGRVTLALDTPVPWDRVLDLVLKMNRLEKRVEDGIIRITTQETLLKEDQARAERQKVRRALESQTDLITEYITANYADVEKNIKPHLEAILTKNVDGSPRGTLSVDTRNNVLIITDVPKAILRAKEIVKELDRVTPQVLIEARVVEANMDLSQSLGIRWRMAGGIPNDSPGAGIGPQRGFGNIGGTYGWDTAVNFPVANAPSIGFNFSRILGSPFLLDMQLSALEEQGSARIISSPRILTLDNQEALIQQGEEYPYRDTKESTDGTSGVVVTKFKDIDLKLKVRPHITPDQRISMKVFIEKKDIAGFVQTEAGTLIPRINNKKAETEFLMNDGETIVIGGINRTTERISKSGVPLISRIPILGWFFKTKANENNREELLIFITPKISRLGQKSVAHKPAAQTMAAF